MAISFVCPSCGKRLRIAADDAGRPIVCPKCGTPFEAPAPPAAADVNNASAETTAPQTPANPFATPKEIIVPGSSAGFLTEDELPPDPEIRVRVFGPAVALMAVGLCGFLLRLAGVFRNNFGSTISEMAARVEGLLWPGRASATVVFFTMSVVLILSGHRMRNLQSYWFAVGASVLAMVPCVSPCCTLGVPVGIWSLTVLWNEEVKRAFRE